MRADTHPSHKAAITTTKARQIIEEQRKIRHLLGALINAQNVATAHQINLQASQARVIDDWLERSQIPVQPYRGAGGFGPDDYRH